MTCEQCNDLFVGAYYGELDGHERSEFDRHMADCSKCSASYREFERTLALMARRAPATPDEAFAANFWASLKTKISDEPARRDRRIIPFPSRFSGFASMPGWAYAVAAALLIAIGIYLGKTYFGAAPGLQERPREERLATLPADSLSPAALQKEVDEYLDRSRTLLLGVIHASDSQPAENLSTTQQQRSRQLIEQASFIEARLKEPDRERFRQLIGDLTVVLRELANYSNESGVPLIEIVRQGVDTRSILLKINLEQMRSLGAGLKAGEPRTSVDPKSKI